MQWYHTIVLICISLITNDVEELSMYLLAICLSSLEGCIFKSFAHFYFILFFIFFKGDNDTSYPTHFFKKIFIYLAVPGLSCGTRDLRCHLQDL